LTINHYRIALTALVAAAVMVPAAFLTVRALSAEPAVRPRAVEYRYPPLETALGRGVIDQYRLTHWGPYSPAWTVDDGDIVVSVSDGGGGRSTMRIVWVYYRADARAKATAVRRLIRAQDPGAFRVNMGPPGF
jgi:hypothetical protein